MGWGYWTLVGALLVAGLFCAGKAIYHDRQAQKYRRIGEQIASGGWMPPPKNLKSRY
jgi:hypothetical protein